MSNQTGPALVLAGITKAYPGVRALDDVSVTVERGRVHAVLGENGAGKSTLVGIAAGSVVPDTGTIVLAGQEYARIRPREARQQGLAIVYQIPALAPSLSVVDAVMLLLPDDKRPARRAAHDWVVEQFTRLGLEIDPQAPISSLSQREAHLIEIAAALASEPDVLVLDEPTEALGPEETRWLFAQVHDLLARGVAIVYITHRIPEVIEIGTDLTVLRDGKVVGRGKVADFDADQIVELIVGRSLETTFPDKAGPATEAPLLEVEGLAGPGFRDVSFAVRPGQVIGLAGVEGNGQRELMRGLAGRGSTAGTVRVRGAEVSLRSARSAFGAGIVFLPGDRIGEAMFPTMTIRENVVAPNLALAMPVGVVDRGREYALTREGIAGLAVKTPHLESPITSLSGGSQQKVLLARSRLGDPKVLLVEDPTQGVDAGARVEIYAFLRQLADSGVAVVVLSTDAVELEGLCDRVLVFSRGSVRANLDGDDVTERSITGAAVLSADDHDVPTVVAVPRRKRRFFAVRGELQAVAVLALTVLLAVYTASRDSAFLSSLSVGALLAGAATLVLVGLAQLLVVMTGGIDLSVGSTVGLTGVVVSFYAASGSGTFLGGVVLALAAGLAVGVANGLLVTRLAIPPVIATLVSSIAILGVAQVLRKSPGGSASMDLMTQLGTTVAGVPMVLIVALVITGLLWWVIQRTGLGRGLRAAGSDAVKANRMGVDVRRMRFLAMVASGVLCALAGITVYSRTGIGDANSGQSLTLISVTAIVIAGASIFGGSGSAVAVASAGLLLQTITSALTFLSFNLSWQYWLQGIFVLLAAVLPVAASRLRVRRAAPAAR
jgi:ribose transport system ATP-binding protein